MPTGWKIVYLPKNRGRRRERGNGMIFSRVHITACRHPTSPQEYVACPNCVHMKTPVNQTVNVFDNKATSQTGTSGRARWPEVSLHPEGPATGQLDPFLGPRADAQLAPKLHVALRASHAASKC
jgi:hypothetical protein